MQNEPHGVCLNSKGKNKKSLGNLPFICRQTFLKNENLITLMKKWIHFFSISVCLFINFRNLLADMSILLSKS